MKKLMFAAVGIVACTALAKGPADYDQGTALPEGVAPGVYNITLTHKGLDLVKTTKTKAQVTTGLNKELPYETPEEAYLIGRQVWEDIISESYQGLENECPEPDIVVKGSDQKGYTWKISYIVPTVVKGKPTSKVVTTTIKGLLFADENGTANTYLWNDAVKGSFTNTFAKADTTKSYNFTDEDYDKVVDKKNELENRVGYNVGDVQEDSISDVTPSGTKKFKVTWKEITKKNTVSLACGYEELFFLSEQTRITVDGKAASGFSWDNMVAWGTGTAKKDSDKESPFYNEYVSISSVAGNTVDGGIGLYGTWKFSLDVTATKKYNGANVEEILASKKVELCQ